MDRFDLVDPVFAALVRLPSGMFWVVSLLVGLVVLCELAGLRYIPNDRVGIVEKLWSAKGSVPEGRIIALERRGRLPGRPAPRRPPLRPLALAVPHPQGAAGHHPAGQDRLRLRPRRRAAAAEPDARPRRRLQQLPGRPRASWRASRPARRRAGRSASAAGSGRSSAKASTRSTSPCSSSSPRTRSTA